MNFKLSTTNWEYNEEDAFKLLKLGFRFKEITFSGLPRPLYRIINEDVDIQFNTIEDLLDFSKEWGEIIVSDGKIVIHDGYLY